MDSRIQPDRLNALTTSTRPPFATHLPSRQPENTALTEK